MNIDRLYTVHVDGILMNNFITMFLLLITPFLLDAGLVATAHLHN